MLEFFFCSMGLVCLFGLAYWGLKPKAQRCNFDDLVDAGVSAAQQGYSHIRERWANRKKHSPEASTPAMTQETVSSQVP